MTVIALVAVFCIVASAACLLFAIVFAFSDKKAAAKVRDAAQQAGEAITNSLTPSEDGGNSRRTPAQMQSAGVDFGGIAKLAEALEKLNPSGRFLIGSVVFAATAALVTSIGSVAGH